MSFYPTLYFKRAESTLIPCSGEDADFIINSFCTPHSLSLQVEEDFFEEGRATLTGGTIAYAVPDTPTLLPETV